MLHFTSYKSVVLFLKTESKEKGQVQFDGLLHVIRDGTKSLLFQVFNQFARLSSVYYIQEVLFMSNMHIVHYSCNNFGVPSNMGIMGSLFKVYLSKWHPEELQADIKVQMASHKFFVFNLKDSKYPGKMIVKALFSCYKYSVCKPLI